MAPSTGDSVSATEAAVSGTVLCPDGAGVTAESSVSVVTPSSPSVTGLDTSTGASVLPESIGSAEDGPWGAGLDPSSGTSVLLESVGSSDEVGP